MKKIEMWLASKDLELFEIINDGVIITDHESRIVYFNKAYLHYSGLDKNSIYGKLMNDLRPGSRLLEVMKTGTQIRNLKRTGDGFESYCDLSPIYDDGEIIGSISVVKDAVILQSLMSQQEKNLQKEEYLEEKLRQTHETSFNFESMIFEEESMKKIVDTCKRIAEGNSSVLITGESGTGKEVLAQSIHNASSRSGYPFVPVNCSAIPENLWESEFFGYNAGAFTGASNIGKIGLFEVASAGTLFLDEITEIPLHLQSKLLRALEEKKIRKIGSKNEVSVDVRVIAASNKDISNLVRENKFRSDLYYRLAVVPIHLPPLRMRRKDIPVFIEFFLKEMTSNSEIIEISEEVREIFDKYFWPGNVRELRNVLEYAVNFTDNHKIERYSLPKALKHEFVSKDSKSLKEMVRLFEKSVIEETLALTGNDLESKKTVAKGLEISLATLYNKLNQT